MSCEVQYGNIMGEREGAGKGMREKKDRLCCVVSLLVRLLREYSHRKRRVGAGRKTHHNQDWLTTQWDVVPRLGPDQSPRHNEQPHQGDSGSHRPDQFLRG
ncbi:hypothetical protein J4Q44_G00070610 [Coregonus suidteri]|uniref:Uncharacterized protein n=1 Tax=Coregonus suidteri TaxID=861788 RepID=A0AAN8M514_9TELE